MRIVLITLAVLACVATAGACILMLFYFSKSEQEKRRAQTAPARASRWAKEEPVVSATEGLVFDQKNESNEKGA